MGFTGAGNRARRCSAAAMLGVLTLAATVGSVRSAASAREPSQAPSSSPASATRLSRPLLVDLDDKHGHRIVYRTLTGHVVRLGPSTGLGAFSIAFSPDGSHLAVGGDRVFTIATPGGDRHVYGYGDQPDWSPDGRAIVYTAYSGTSDGSLWVGRDGHAERLLPASAATDLSPTWGPDSRHVAFVRQIDTRNGNIGHGSGIFVTDGTTTKRLYLDPRGSYVVEAVWSPDGRHIAFAQEQRSTRKLPDGPTADIYVMNANGTHVRQLTHTPGRDESEMHWSADSKQLVFTVEVAAARSGIASMRASGGAPCVAMAGWSYVYTSVWAPGSYPGTTRATTCRSMLPPKPPAVLGCTHRAARSAVDRSRLPLDFKAIGHVGLYTSISKFCPDLDRDGKSDLIVLFNGGGSGGTISWAAFRRGSRDWQFAGLHSGDRIEIAAHDHQVIETTPIYNRRDAHCCPTGGVRHRLFRWKNGWLRLVATWRTKS